MRGIKVKTGDEILSLEGFNLLSGKHCESSAMINAMNYHGLAVSENEVNGMAASMSFGITPDKNFPMIMMRIGNMKERFSKASGIRINEFYPDNSQQAYDEVKSLLRQNIAVVLRVNMRYLPYLYGGKYGPKNTSFGWHFVTLVKLDEVSGYAWVTDTAHKSLQKIKLADLAKARDSKEGELKADNVYYYFDSLKGIEIDYEAAYRKSLYYLLENYEGTEGIINQLERLPDFIVNIEAETNKFILSPLFYVWYGYIEEFGTGGSGFRNFTLGYFIKMRSVLKYNNMDSLIEAAEKVCALWLNLALKFKAMSKEITNIKSAEKRAEEYKKAAYIAENVIDAEKCLYRELKELIEKI